MVYVNHDICKKEGVNMKHLLSILLLCFALFFIFPVATAADEAEATVHAESSITNNSEDAISYGVWEYTLYEGNAIISAYNGSATVVTVPGTIDGLKVVGLGRYVFEDYVYLTNVTLPDSLESIGAYAFYGCTRLKSITLPEKLETVGSSAFYNCKSLEKIIVKSEKLDDFYSWGDTFYNAGKESENGITVEFTDTVTVIPSYMFYCSSDYYARVTNVTIGSKATIIGTYAFCNCYNLEDVTLATDIDLRTIGNYAFNNCIQLKSIVFPKKLESIGYRAFYNCEALEKITVKSISLKNFTEKNTFYEAGKETAGIDVVFEDTVKQIPSRMFYCDSSYYARIKSVKIGSAVNTIGVDAFAYCYDLQKVTISDNSDLRTIDDGSFYSCISLESIILPEKLETVDYKAFYNCTSLKKITVKSNTLNNFYSSGNTFYNAGKESENGITVEFTDTVTKIPAYMFYCSSDYYARVSTVISGKAVEEIGKYAFRDCYDLTTIQFRGDAPAIDSYAFYNVNATAYYPTRSSWQFAVDGNYGGSINWLSYLDLEAPEISIANRASDGKPRLTWDAVDSAVKYQIFRSTTKNGTYTRIYTQKGTTYTNTKAVAGTTYYYKVKAVDAEGNVSDFSNRVSRMCDLARPVVKTANVAASGKIKLTWAQIDGARSYKIYRSTAKNGKYTLQKTVTAATYTDSTAKAGTKYFYKVIAVHENSNANSAYSAIVSRMADLARPVVTVKRNDAGKPRLSWKKVEGAVKYEIWRSTAKNGKYTKIATTKNLYQVNKNAKAGVTYYYKVKAVHSNSNANSAFSAIKYIKAK